MLKHFPLLAAVAALVALAAPADARPEGRGRDRGAQVDRPRPQPAQQERVQVRPRREPQQQQAPQQRRLERDEVKGPQREQNSAYAARQQGRIRPLPEIELNIRRRMPGADYLGPELDMVSGIYRLKFLRGDRVIWIDVDGRTGRVVGKSGN